MKKTAIVVMALVMLGAAAAGAEELKLKVPVEKWQKLRSRLYSLERENLILKKKLRRAAGKEAEAAAGGEAARLERLAAENDRLRREIEELRRSRTASAGDAGRLRALEEENRKLKREVDGLKAAAAAGGGGKSDKRIAALERRNRRLKKKIQALRSGVVAIAYTGEMRCARAEFFRARRRAQNVTRQER